MPIRNVASAADDANATNALLELGWNSEDREDNWLISYADLLSVIFAMVVLLFGRMFATAAAAPDAADALHDALDRRAGDPSRGRSRTGDTFVATRKRARRARRATIQRPHRGAPARSRHRPGDPGRRVIHVARADLEPAAIPLLTELAATLRQVGDARIAVEGHTDDFAVQGGTFDSNWSLAAARANAVTRFLLDQGFAPDRLQSVSYADTRPVADNSTTDGRAANRRVELQIELSSEVR